MSRASSGVGPWYSLSGIGRISRPIAGSCIVHVLSCCVSGALWNAASTFRVQDILRGPTAGRHTTLVLHGTLPKLCWSRPCAWREPVDSRLDCDTMNLTARRARIHTVDSSACPEILAPHLNARYR